MNSPERQLPLRAKLAVISLSLALVAIVGLVDYVSGFELNFSTFYLVPIAVTVWFIGTPSGIFVSALCVAASAAGDVRAGARYSSSLVIVWNAAISLAFYSTVVWICSKLRNLQRGLERRVRERTVALTNEVRERQRLEEEILRISEREQRRIGHDLHDSLCQHLTGTAFAGQVLVEQLSESAPREAAAAEKIVSLIEESIELTRKLARGLHPVELQGEGLMDALRELAASGRGLPQIPCVFECPQLVAIEEPGIAIELFRIAQEAVANATRHSRAHQILVRLERIGEEITISISDDGVGIPETQSPKDGMGLGIMAYRARVIGAEFRLERPPSGGTRVVVSLPAAAVQADPGRHAHVITPKLSRLD